MAMYMYNQDYKKLPNGWADPSTGNWAVLIGSYLGAPLSRPANSQEPWTAKVFQCPEALPPKMTGIDDNGDDPTYPGGHWGRVVHYSPHPRVIVHPDPNGDPATGQPIKFRSLESIKNSAEKAIVWDGPNSFVSNEADRWGMAHPDNRHLDGNGMWSHRFADPPPASYTGDLDMPPALGENGYASGSSLAVAIAIIKQYNKDLQDYRKCQMRFRHRDNTSINLLYADGHVESKAIGEVKRREILINVN